MPTDKEPSLASVKIHPALIVCGSLIAALHARNNWPLAIENNWVAVALIGLVLILAGIAVTAVAYTSMYRARTTIDPNKHSTAVVATGVYKFSRNPIYLGWFCFIAGIGIRNSSISVLTISIIMIVLLHWAVVLEEEKYLENKFGDEYLQYKNSVRRWL